MIDNLVAAARLVVTGCAIVRLDSGLMGYKPSIWSSALKRNEDRDSWLYWLRIEVSLC